MSKSVIVAVGLVVSVAAHAAAQEAPEITGPRRLMPRAEEIVLARSAAPAEVSAAATVLVLESGGYVVADKGTNGVTCYVSRSQPESVEPHCFDEEASQSILPMNLRRAELRQQNVPAEEIDRDIAEGIANGRFRLPRRPAMSYMMSAAQVLYNDQGRKVGAWQPHIMIYYPYLTAEQLGLGGPPSPRAAMVANAGTARASIVVVVSEFVQPAGAAAQQPKS
jgi:hypothetical protein